MAVGTVGALIAAPGAGASRASHANRTHRSRAPSTSNWRSCAGGHLQCVVRWGANDGPDDAFENFNRWPELHALGGSDDVLQMFVKGHDGLIEQYRGVIS